MRPPLPRTKQHCGDGGQFGYFAEGCFTPTDRPATLRIWLALASSIDSALFKMLMMSLLIFSKKVNEFIALIF